MISVWQLLICIFVVFLLFGDLKNLQEKIKNIFVNLKK